MENESYYSVCFETESGKYCVCDSTGECDLADGIARLRVCRCYVWLS